MDPATQKVMKLIGWLPLGINKGLVVGLAGGIPS
jgi:hypothetical protein